MGDEEFKKDDESVKKSIDFVVFSVQADYYLYLLNKIK